MKKRRKIKSMPQFILACTITLLFSIGIITTVVLGVDLFIKNEEAKNVQEMKGFESEKQEPEKQIPIEEEVAEIIDTNDPLEITKNKLRTGDTEELKVVFLTFDDGPNEHTNEVLDILKAHDIKGTFFTNVNDSEVGKAAYRRIVEEGHTLGNHTASHDYHLYDTPEGFYGDVEALDKFQQEVTGEKESSGMFRFPGGSSNANKTCVDGIVEKGYTYVDWNVVAGDGNSNPPPKEVVEENIIKGCQPFHVSVVLTHAETKPDSRKALPVVIETLKEEGYTFLPMEKDFMYSNARHVNVT